MSCHTRISLSWWQTLAMSAKKTFRPTQYHIYAPKDLGKRWFVYFYQAGQRVRVTAGINHLHTYQERMAAAEAVIDRLKEEHEKLDWQNDTADLLRAFVEKGRPSWSVTTQKGYAASIDHFCAFLGDKELSEKVIVAYFEELASSHHGTTYNMKRTLLRQALKAIGVADLFKQVPPQRVQKTPARYFQKFQAKQLAEAIQAADSELWLFVQFMYYTFIRPKELRLLKVGDVLLDAAEIRVPGTISKNKKTQYVAIPDAFLSALHCLYNRRPSETVFVNEKTGEPYSKNVMYSRHKKYLDALGFGAGYELYSWKHTGAVALAKAGVSIKEIQLQMRHHSLDQTDEYLRQMGIRDVVGLRGSFPRLI